MEANEFKRRFLPYHRRLYRVAFCLTGNREDAEDMVQEAYLRLWNKRDDLAGVDNVEAFCVRTVKNLSLNLLRDRKTDIAAGDEYDRMPSVADDKDAMVEIESRDACNVVTKLIERLPEAQRRVIMMRDVGDCTYEEIESHTGFSQGNIRTMLSRARRKIKEQYIAIMNYELK